MYDLLKKKFGQNFLIDKNVLLKICKLIPRKNLNITEIGPGNGSLTEFIMDYKPSKIVIVEIDTDLIKPLKNKFKNINNFKVINEDILKYEFEEKVDLIISNLPYNISSQILARICSLNITPEYMILMFQKEFALRLLNKKINSLNSLVNCFYEIETNFNVSKFCFRPIPKVESKVLFFRKKIKPLLKKSEISNFVEFKRELFSYKRKLLKNTLKKYNFTDRKYELNQRVEDLSLNNLVNIFRSINF